MTSYKPDTGRKAYMSKLAAEAATILSSETASPASKAEFIRDNAWRDVSGPWTDDSRFDLMALVVLDDFPSETLNDILRMNTEEADEPYLWLADTYDTIPDFNPAEPATQGTSHSVDSSWCSPFTGYSVEEIAAFIQAAPKPSKALGKQFFAVLRKEQYEQSKQLTIYRITESESGDTTKVKLQSVPCPVHLAGYFYSSFSWESWNKAVDEQALYYGEGAFWSDDDNGTQLMALVVLDDFSPEEIDKILEENSEQAEDDNLWLADTYSNLPDYSPHYKIDGTEGPISSDWRSPFAGKSIEDAANFIRNAPKPPKPLCKRFFAVLQKDRFDHHVSTRICKIVPDKDEINFSDDELSEEELKSIAEHKAHMKRRIRDKGNSIICKAEPGEGEFEVQMLEVESNYAGMFFSGGNRYEWEEGLI